MLKYLRMIGIGVVDRRKTFKIVKKFPFSSSRKRMSTVIETLDGKWILYIKGASEFVVDASDYIHDLKTSKLTLLDDDWFDKVERGIETMAQMALRTIGIGFRELDKSTNLENLD